MVVKPKLTVNVWESDLGMSKILAEAAKIRKKPYVKAGITQAKGSKVRPDGKKTTAEIAQIHEYGAPDAGIPERSFIRSTVSTNQSKYDGQIASLRDQIFDANSDLTVEKALGLIGQSASSDMKKTIRAGIQPPLKEATIRAKNAGQIAKAEGTVRSLEKKYGQRAYQDALKNGGRGKGRLTAKESQRLDKASETVATGGESTPLIDTAQMINALSYEVVLDGGSENGTEGGAG